TASHPFLGWQSRLFRPAMWKPRKRGLVQRLPLLIIESARRLPDIRPAAVRAQRPCEWLGDQALARTDPPFLTPPSSSARAHLYDRIRDQMLLLWMLQGYDRASTAVRRGRETRASRVLAE